MTWKGSDLDWPGLRVWRGCSRSPGTARSQKGRVREKGSRPRDPVRFWRFVAVSGGGLIVQILLLRFFLQEGLHPLGASLLAVEGAVLHNFLWHRSWTWRDRPSLQLQTDLQRLGRFHLANGLTSLLGNAFIISVCLEYTAVGPLGSSLIAVSVCGVANYLLADRYAFRA